MSEDKAKAEVPVISPEDISILYNLLGECDHQVYNAGEIFYGSGHHNYFCQKCNQRMPCENYKSHTFTSSEDMAVVSKAIQDKNLWDEFMACVLDSEGCPVKSDTVYRWQEVSQLAAWFIVPPRFCKLAAEWWFLRMSKKLA